MNRQNHAVVFLATLICATFLSSTWSSAGARPAGARTGSAQSADDVAAKVKFDSRKIEEGAKKRRDADRKRDERMNKLGASICTGCGGPIVPFDPTGGTPGIGARSKTPRR